VNCHFVARKSTLGYNNCSFLKINHLLELGLKQDENTGLAYISQIMTNC